MKTNCTHDTPHRAAIKDLKKAIAKEERAIAERKRRINQNEKLIGILYDDILDLKAEAVKAAHFGQFTRLWRQIFSLIREIEHLERSALKQRQKVRDCDKMITLYQMTITRNEEMEAEERR